MCKKIPGNKGWNAIETDKNRTSCVSSSLKENFRHRKAPGQNYEEMEKQKRAVNVGKF